MTATSTVETAVAHDVWLPCAVCASIHSRVPPPSAYVQRPSRLANALRVFRTFSSSWSPPNLRAQSTADREKTMRLDHSRPPRRM
eukprot:15596-Rhodomonas_salina.1